MAHQVELVALTKSYGDGRDAVRDVSLTVTRGEFFSILGPSGCGKSTTLRMIAGFVPPTSGAVVIDGVEVTGLPPERRHVGIVFQNYAIFPHMSVGENIAYGLKLRRMGRAEREAKVAAALRQVSLEGYADRAPDRLSGGEQQRVALARVIVLEPKLLLLDEPLSALDKKLRDEMRLWLKRLQAELGITTVYVTHDQDEALSLSDRIAVMAGGRVQQVGPPDALYERPANRFVADFVGESNIWPVLAAQRVGEATRITLGPGIDVVAEAAPPAAAGLSLMVRPEQILIDAPDDEAFNVFAGRLEQLSYHGSALRYTVRLDGDVLVRGERANLGRSGLSPGQTVRVGWRRSHGVILSAA